LGDLVSAVLARLRKPSADFVFGSVISFQFRGHKQHVQQMLAKMTIDQTFTQASARVRIIMKMKVRFCPQMVCWMV
jgi:hypothetical protein